MFRRSGCIGWRDIGYGGRVVMECMEKMDGERGVGFFNELVIRCGLQWKGLIRLGGGWWCIVGYDVCRLHS